MSFSTFWLDTSKNKVLDLSCLGPSWPTVGPNLVTQMSSYWLTLVILSTQTDTSTDISLTYWHLSHQLTLALTPRLTLLTSLPELQFSLWIFTYSVDFAIINLALAKLWQGGWLDTLCSGQWLVSSRSLTLSTSSFSFYVFSLFRVITPDVDFYIYPHCLTQSLLWHVLGVLNL